MSTAISMMTIIATLRTMGSRVRSLARRLAWSRVEAVVGCIQTPVERGPQRVQAEIGHQQDQDRVDRPAQQPGTGRPVGGEAGDVDAPDPQQD